jgi:hypothetical protein
MCPGPSVLGDVSRSPVLSDVTRPPVLGDVSRSPGLSDVTRPLVLGDVSRPSVPAPVRSIV